MTNSRVVLLFLFSFSIGNATEPTKAYFQFDSKKIEFVEFLDKRILISSSCVDSNNIRAICLINLKLKELSLKKILPLQIGGKNLGGLICKNELNGVSILGLDPRGNENTFCKITDNIIVDNGTLEYYGRINDSKFLQK
jgi:hypothetical protein